MPPPPHTRPEVQRNRSRMETNLIRLLSRCETMAMDTESLQDNWRLEKYVEALEDMLKDLKSGPNVPAKDTLLEYGRKIEFIKGIIHTAKMPTVSEKAAAAQLISPGPSPYSSGLDQNRSMELKHRVVTKYGEDLRQELLGSPSSSSKKNKTPEDMDELLKYHQNMQEQIAEHMIELTRTLKSQVKAAGQIIKSDTEMLEKSAKIMDTNQSALKIEADKVEMYNKSACKCWVWVLLFVVCSTFIGMVLFMRLFKKRLVPAASV